MPRPRVFSSPPTPPPPDLLSAASLSELLAIRYRSLHRELADALGGRGPAIARSSRRRFDREYARLLSRHMGLTLPDWLTARDLAPTFSTDLVRRQRDECECEGWDVLMRRIEAGGHPDLERLGRILRHHQLEPPPGELPGFPASPLLDPSAPLLQQLEIDAEEVLDRMLDCEMDLLGTYSVEHGITLYHVRIGLVAEALGVEPFELGLVVYVHELAHLISQRGLDFDGNDWDTDSFQRSSTYTKETIAQWYTYLVVVGRAEAKAFYRLLDNQSEPYTAFTDWMVLRQNREDVRTCMLWIRRSVLPDDQPRGTLIRRVEQLGRDCRENP